MLHLVPITTLSNVRILMSNVFQIHSSLAQASFINNFSSMPQNCRNVFFFTYCSLRICQSSFDQVAFSKNGHNFPSYINSCHVILTFAPHEAGSSCPPLTSDLTDKTVAGVTMGSRHQKKTRSETGNAASTSFDRTFVPGALS